MSQSQTKIEQFADFVLKYRWLVILATILLVVAIGNGAKHLSLSTDFRYFFGKENPQLIAFDLLEETYSKHDNILFVFHHPEHNMFTEPMIEMQRAFTDKSWELPYSIRVDSLTNFQRMQAEGDDLIVDSLFPDDVDVTDDFIAQAKAYALSEPILYKRLLIDNTEYVGLNVTFELPGESPKEVPHAVSQARALVKEMQSQHPALEVYMTGGMMINNAFSEAAQADIKSFIPAMYLVILLTVFIMTGSLSGMIATLIVITFSTVMAMGIAGYFETKLTPPSMTSPILIMTLAIADCVHVMLTALVNMRQGMEKNAAIKESIRLNFMPVLITSVTTALGFLTINFSDSPPLNDLGNIVAVGVMAAFLLSVTLFPALLSILPVKAKVSENRLGMMMERLGEFVIQKRQPLLFIMIIVSLGLTALTPLNKGNDSFIEYFDETIQFRTDTDKIYAELTGMFNMSFSFDSGSEGGVSDPEYLQKLEEIKAWFETKDYTMHVQTVSDIFKSLNKNMHAGEEEYYRLPDALDLAAQYLLLYEMSLPYGLDLTNQISQDKSASKFTVTTHNVDAIQMRQIVEEVMEYLGENYPELQTPPVSPNIMFSYISERNIKSMVYGMIAALIGISLLMIFALRDFKIGLLSLVPNLLPMGMAFGVWGLVVGEVNFTMAVVMGMTLGIVVDDTVHILSKYLRARKEQALSSADSVRYAFKHVGGALFTMSVVLIAGFSVLANSHFLANSGMSKLTVIAIACALIADFFLLPPLLMLVDKDRKKKPTQENA